MRKVLTLLWIALACLVALGLVLVYTASTPIKAGAFSIFKKQLVSVVVGIVVAVVLGRIDYRVWGRKNVAIVIGVLCCVLGASVFGGEKVNGSRRWISIAGNSLQPSECVRVGMVLVMAAWFRHVGPASKEFLKGFVYPGLILGAIVAPVLAAPDVGATLVMLMAAAAIFMCAGTKWKYMFPGAVVAAAVLALFIMRNPNKRSRVYSFIDGMRGIESTEKTAEQGNQSQRSFEIGGAWGRGLGNSVQKYHYLPEANSDFIFAIAGEEFGLVGTAGVVVCFMVLLFCGTYVAYHACDRYGRMVALGITTLVSFEAAFNIGMSTGCLPTKGIALPFISNGGSSMIMTLASMGILFSIGSYSARKEADGVARDSIHG